MSPLEVATQFFVDHPGYLEWGLDRLSARFSQWSRETVAQAKQDAKNYIRGTNDSASTSTHKQPATEDSIPRQDEDGKWQTYQEFLDERGITEDDVTSVKFWQTMGGEPRYSVVMKNEEPDIGRQDLEDASVELLRSYKPESIYLPGPTEAQEKCAIVNLFDAHIDKIALPDEVYGVQHQTIEGNFETLKAKFMAVVESIRHENPEVIFFPVGSDFWNSNGSMNTTKKGTPQRALVPHEVSFRMGVDFYRWCIDILTQISPKVVVISLKGNHDEDPVFYLSQILDITYEDHPRVEVNATRHQRKYFQYGDFGFGFGHGDKEKRQLDRLPLFFAQEGTEIWAATKFREMFFGDLHHRNEYKFKRARDGVGCYVYFLRSTNEADLWHSDSGWIGIPKAINAFVYQKNGGEKKNVSVNW